MTHSTPFSDQIVTLLDELKSSLAFLTRLPPSLIGADTTMRPHFTMAARVFPVAGALIGLAGGVVLALGWLLGLPSWIVAALAVAATMALTGALHEDGLADTADSFGGGSRGEKLAIMDDSRIGTYGTLALAISVLVRTGALTVMVDHGPLVAVLALIAGEAVSRAALVRLWHDLPPARASGLAHDTGPPEHVAMVTALATASVIVLATALPAVGWRATALASIFAIAASYAVIRVTANAFGGRTGDTLGACQQVTLAAFLAGAASL